MIPAPPTTDGELDLLLSVPQLAVSEALRSCPGDIAVVGAGGKMGPSLARMAKRALDELGRHDRVIAISRFSSPGLAHQLESAGIVVHQADLCDSRAVAALPLAPNMLYLAGQKFGTQDAPDTTWYVNTVVPSMVVERYRESRVVAFSTGNVYALAPTARGGSTEGEA